MSNTIGASDNDAVDVGFQELWVLQQENPSAVK